MLFELDPGAFEIARPFFAAPPLALIFDAVVAGHAPARLWADDAADPQTVFMWDEGHCFYLAGQAKEPAVLAALTERVEEAVARGVTVATIRCTPADWEKVLPALFRRFSPAKRGRAFCALTQPRTADRGEGLPHGFHLRRIDESLFGAKHLAHQAVMTGAINSMWRDPGDFLRHGLGYCVTNDAAILCWCTAEYVSEGKCGIGVETVQEYQGRGFATLAATAFVRECLARGLAPHWEAWQTNAPSLKVAEKVGFTPAVHYDAFFGRLS